MVRPGPVDSPARELGLGFFDRTPPDGGSPEALDFGPLNFVTGTNAAYSIRFPAPSTGADPVLVRLAHSADENFYHEEPSDAFAFARGNVLAVFVPAVEWEGAAAYRLFGYFQDQSTFAAVTDTQPNMGQPMAPVDATPLRVTLP